MRNSGEMLRGGLERPQSLFCLAAFCMTVFLVNLDITAINLSLASIQGSFHSELPDLQWVIDSYVLAFACIVLAAGSIADRVGLRAALLTGLAGFGLASLCCAVAPNLTCLVIARALQGASAAITVPAMMANIALLWSDPAERAAAVAAAALAGGLGLACGPTIAGTLVIHYGWPSIFLLNIPVIAAALAVIHVFIPVRIGNGLRRLRLRAQVLLSLVFFGMAYALIEWPRAYRFSLPVIASIVLALAAALALWRSERSSDDRLVPRQLLRNRVIIICGMAGFACQAAAFCLLFLLSIKTQKLAGMSVAESGMSLLPITVSTLMFSMLTMTIRERAAFRWIITAGLGLLALGNAGLALAPDWTLIWFPCLGAAFASLTSPISLAVLAATQHGHAATATALLNTARQLGALFGAAFAGLMVVVFVRGALDALAGRDHLAPVPQTMVIRLASVDTSGLDPASPLVATAKLAFASSARAAFLSMAVVAAVLGAAALWGFAPDAWAHDNSNRGQP